MKHLCRASFSLFLLTTLTAGACGPGRIGEDGRTGRNPRGSGGNGGGVITVQDPGNGPSNPDGPNVGTPGTKQDAGVPGGEFPTPSGDPAPQDAGTVKRDAATNIPPTTPKLDAAATTKQDAAPGPTVKLDAAPSVKLDAAQAPDAPAMMMGSGLPATAKLAELSATDKRTFCDWGSALAGGYGSTVTCPGGRIVKLPWNNLDTCVRAIPPGCPVTVTETENCARAVVADPCNEEIQPACRTLAKCVLDYFLGDGGVADTKPAVVDTRPPLPPAPACALGSTIAEIEEKLFVPKCGLCHGPNSPIAPLDLKTPGMAARVLGQSTSATHAMAQCQGRVMMTADNPLGGLFLDKIQNPAPACGTAMPLGTPLNAEEVACVKRWAILAAGGQ